MERERLKIFHPVETRQLCRLGNHFDGGYIVDFWSLSDADYLVNYGVGYNVEFEKDFYRSTGKRTLAFDPTLKQLSRYINELKKGQIISFLRHVKNRLVWFVTENKLRRYRIKFFEEGISSTNTENYKSLKYHYDKFGLHDKKIILKVDVEGAAYEIFDDPSFYKLLGNCVQLIVEFHEVGNNFDRLLRIMEQLKRTHALIHLHSNNNTGTFAFDGREIPETMEMTFLLNRYLPEKKYSKSQYPVFGLDNPSHRLKPDIALNFFY